MHTFDPHCLLCFNIQSLTLRHIVHSSDKFPFWTKSMDIFLFTPWKKCYRYSLEPPWWGVSYEYNTCFHREVRKVLVLVKSPWTVFCRGYTVFFYSKNVYAFSYFFTTPCVYLQELPCQAVPLSTWGNSNEYSQHVFLWRSKKYLYGDLSPPEWWYVE